MGCRESGLKQGVKILGVLGCSSLNWVGFADAGPCHGLRRIAWVGQDPQTRYCVS